MNTPPYEYQRVVQRDIIRIGFHYRVMCYCTFCNFMVGAISLVNLWSLGFSWFYFVTSLINWAAAVWLVLQIPLVARFYRVLKKVRAVHQRLFDAWVDVHCGQEDAITRFQCSLEQLEAVSAELKALKRK